MGMEGGIWGPQWEGSGAHSARHRAERGRKPPKWGVSIAAVSGNVLCRDTTGVTVWGHKG